jgi:hypothetical protein
MIRVSEAEARLLEKVPKLAGKVGSAAQFSSLIERNQVPQQTPAAFIILGGLQGGPADVAAGMFRQAIREMLLIVLFVRNAGDATGARAVDEITPLVREIVLGLAGWGPDACPGVYVLDHVEIVTVSQGVVGFEIGLALDDQLRIQP